MGTSDHLRIMHIQGSISTYFDQPKYTNLDTHYIQSEISFTTTTNKLLGVRRVIAL